MRKAVLITLGVALGAGPVAHTVLAQNSPMQHQPMQHQPMPRRRNRIGCL